MTLPAAKVIVLVQKLQEEQRRLKEM